MGNKSFERYTNDDVRVVFHRVDEEFVWNNGEAIYSNTHQELFDRYLSGRYGLPLECGEECNFSHMKPGLNTLQDFTTLLYWTYKGYEVLGEAPDDFREWYDKNSQPYIPRLMEGPKK